jgi:hypothetical protein
MTDRTAPATAKRPPKQKQIVCEVKLEPAAEKRVQSCMDGIDADDGLTLLPAGLHRHHQ